MEIFYAIRDKKLFPAQTGVYLIGFKNSDNDKFYIGSSSKNNSKYKSGNGFYNRWINHISDLRKQKHDSNKLQFAYNKYGEENLFFTVLEPCAPEQCIELEQLYINLFNSYNYGYNSRQMASNQLGFSHSIETIERIINSKRNKRQTYYSDAISLYNQGKQLKEIASILKINCKTVRKILLENNINLPIRRKGSYCKKPIYQYDLYGNFIKLWNSAYECASNLNIQESGIRKVINGKNSHCHNYFFSYENLSITEVYNKVETFKRNRSEKQRKAFSIDRKKLLADKAKNNNFRKKIENIEQYDLDNNLIKIWTNSKEIVIHYNLKNFSAILQVLNHPKYKFRNCYWRCASYTRKIEKTQLNIDILEIPAIVNP